MSWLFSQRLITQFLNNQRGTPCASSRSSPVQAGESSAVTCWAGVPSAPLSVMPTPHRFSRNDKTMEPSNLSRFGLTCAVLTADHGAALLTWFQAGFRARTSASPDQVTASKANGVDSGKSSHGWFARFDRASCSWKTAQCSLLGDSESFSQTWPRSGSMRTGKCYLLPERERHIFGSGSGLWPTPTASMHKGWSPRHNRASTDDRLDYSIEREAHELNIAGRLNPPWVEWLMGWPIGWTDLKPLEMARFREWQLAHSFLPLTERQGAEVQP